MMMGNEQKERVLWLDLLRITAIFAMVMLHIFTGNFLGGDSCWRTADPTGTAWQTLNIYDCLLRFCVPAFCMISGIFFLDPDREQPLRKLFSKNIRRIVTAFVFWSAVYAVVGSLLRAETLGLGLVVDMAKSFVFGHYHLWFLLMLLGFYLIVPFLRKITADRRLTAYFLLLTAVFTFLQNAVLLIAPLRNIVEIQSGKMSLYFVTGYVGYFVLGSYLYRFPPRATVRRLIYALGALSFVGTAVVAGLASRLSGKAIDSYYGYLLPTTLLETAAVFLWFQNTFRNRTFSEKATRVIRTLSAYSFGVYLVHDLFNMLLHRFGITALSFLPAVSVPVLTVAVSAASILTVALLHKIPLFKRYLL